MGQNRRDRRRTQADRGDKAAGPAEAQNRRSTEETANADIKTRLDICTYRREGSTYLQARSNCDAKPRCSARTRAFRRAFASPQDGQDDKLRKTCIGTDTT